MPSELGSSIGRFGLIAAGGYAFGPIGAAAGALLGGFLFGSSGPKIEGPRLGDLDVSSSTYGGVIPLGFGVQKVAGAMIWATDIDEDKNTRKEGGSLFGGGQKIVEYRYFANSAVAFGEGPAGGVLRIWAGDRLIADLRAGAGAYANHPKYRFRIYLGTEDQEPDPLIRQHVENSDDFDGEDATPAFRGLVYIVAVREDPPVGPHLRGLRHRGPHASPRRQRQGLHRDRHHLLIAGPPRVQPPPASVVSVARSSRISCVSARSSSSGRAASA
jgi:hypothetical protein